MTMTPLTCKGCGRGVRVEKFSEAHTSIEWTFDARECPFIAAARDEQGLGSYSGGCAQLRATIDDAVRDGELVVTELELPRGERLPRLH
ncbi:hypothetical protein [Gordonia aurantiaca]|uniref:hypothetical protein n=1 Tax=Gordonia sp. B21 TaxID=3151852 RepID=UPI003264604D